MQIRKDSLKYYLHKNRMTMRALARRAKLSRIEVACLLNGVFLSSQTEARICSALACSWEDLHTPPPARTSRPATHSECEENRHLSSHV